MSSLALSVAGVASGHARRAAEEGVFVGVAARGRAGSARLGIMAATRRDAEAGARSDRAWAMGMELGGFL